MKRAYFQSLEGLSKAVTISLDEVVTESGFDNQGLLPAITQDFTTLMSMSFDCDGKIGNGYSETSI